MPAAPSPLRAEAKSMYLASGGKEKLRSIAEKLSIPEKTVSGWKSKDCWDNELSGVLPKKKRSTPKKKGAPKGNKNAKGNRGGRAPNGEKNGNYQHGGYAAILWDSLDADEMIIAVSDMPDAEALLGEEIRLCSIRERRFMIAIKKYRDAPTGQSLSSIMRTEDKREFHEGEEEEKRLYEELRQQKQSEFKTSYYGHNVTVTSTTQSNIDIITTLESALSQVQGRKTRAITALAAVRLQNEKLKLEKLKMGVGDDDTLRRAKELLGGIKSAF